jgi:type IV pilus assembly protein PilW
MTTPRQFKKQNLQFGVSLIELLIGMAVGLFLLAGLLQVYVSSKHSYDITESLARLQENGRYVSEVLVQDLRRAGYWGGNADVEGSVAGTFDKAAVAAGCNPSSDNWGRMVEQRIVGTNDADYGTCVSGGTRLRGDVLGVRYVSSWTIAAGTFDDNRTYMRSSLFAGRIFLGADDNDTDNIDVPEPNHTGELMGHIYYIGNSGQVTCRGQAVPALYRLALGNKSNPNSLEEIAAGVENIQLRYGEDTDINPSVTRYYDADAVPDWDDVIAARLWVLFRAECPETGYTNTNTYTMGDQSITPNDAFRRQLYSTTVMLRNPNL